MWCCFCFYVPVPFMIVCAASRFIRWKQRCIKLVTKLMISLSMWSTCSRRMMTIRFAYVSCVRVPNVGNMWFNLRICLVLDVVHWNIGWGAFYTWPNDRREHCSYIRLFRSGIMAVVCISTSRANEPNHTHTHPSGCRRRRVVWRYCWCIREQ